MNDDDKYIEKVEKKRNYEYERNLMYKYYLDKGVGMKLIDVLKKIVIDQEKDYIINFIRLSEIDEIIRSTRGKFRFNKDEAQDAIEFAITEFLCITNIDLDNFDEDIFLDEFRVVIDKRAQKIVREGYSAKEFPASDMFVYKYASCDNFDDLINERLDLEYGLNQIGERNREILELKIHDNLTEREIGDIYGVSQQRINQIISETCEEIKKYL
jgi:RNA polymerase sigma factor (sigma-70 family)